MAGQWQLRLHGDAGQAKYQQEECLRRKSLGRRLTCMSAKAFFIDTVPLKATTMVCLFQPRRQRVSSLVSHNSSWSVRPYNALARLSVRMVLGGLGEGCVGGWAGLGDGLGEGLAGEPGSVSLAISLAGHFWSALLDPASALLAEVPQVARSCRAFGKHDCR